ncbi:MAG: aspartate/glutamate racemase family protein [Gammaproteobacteria bacterium]|nr:aspartate/glutamate racemase family protein [Gammaproteobacteria bacterium]
MMFNKYWLQQALTMTDRNQYTPRAKRIGLIVPSSNTNIEPDFAHLCPAGVTIHVARSGGYDVNAIPDSAEMQKFVRYSLDQNLSDLKDARVDMIAYGCTSATLSEGPQFDAQFCALLQQKSGVPAVTTAGALVEAIHSLGVKRVAFTSPYVKALSAEAVDYLVKSNIDVVAEVVFEHELNSLEQNALTPQDAFDMALKTDHKDAQAIVISCTDYRALEAIDAIEAKLGKPVITSNQALMFACLVRLKVARQTTQYGGQLFSI